MKKSAQIIPIKQNELKEQPLSSVWAFEPNPVNYWAYWDNAFSKDECKQIIEYGNKHALSNATIGLDKQKNKVRDSEIVWLYPSEEISWVYQRMTDVVTSLNDRFFKFDIFGSVEGFQFTKYNAPTGKYGKHIDSYPGGLTRKLSFTLQLSDPEEYEGGELCLYFDDKPLIMKKDRGYVCLFPSYVLHEVKPVKRGTRYSLVTWITGKPFK